MPRRLSFTVFVVLTLVLVMTVAAVFDSEIRKTYIGIVIALILYAGPVWLGEDAFDLIDKALDRHIRPNEKVGYWWHVSYSIAIAATLSAIWLMVTPILVEISNSRFGEWLRYQQTLDTSTVLGVFPQYAVGFAQHAFVACILAYHFEALWMRFIWPRLLRAPFVRNFLKWL